MPWHARAARLRCWATVCVVVLAAFAGAAGAASVTDRPAGQRACADLIRYRGVVYEGTFVGRALRRGAHLAAVRPGCNDTPGAHEPDVRAGVTRIVGVAPSLAVLARDNARHVYLVAGVFPEAPNHPLHIALYGNRARPNECLAARVVGSLRIRGTVTATPLAFNLLGVRLTSGVTRQLTIDAWTHLGFPFTRPLVKGSRVDVTAVRCLTPNTTSPILVARRIGLR